MNLEEAPEEPHLYSEPSLLSPASPKPIHFPTPTNIPVLNNMMDVSFNQTELHMQGSTKSELRDGIWKDPELQEEDVTNNTMLSHDAEATTVEPTEMTSADIPMTDDSNDQTSLATTTAQVNVEEQPEHQVAQDTTNTAAADDPSDVTHVDNSLHESVPTSGTAPLSHVDGDIVPEAQAQAPTSFHNVDVQSLLNSLQAAKSATPSSGEALHTPTAPPGADVATLPGGVPEQSSTDAQSSLTLNTNVEPQAGSDLVNALAQGFVQSGSTPTNLTASLIGTTTSPSTLNALNAASQPRAPSSQRERKLAAGEPVTEEDIPWTADVQSKYDDFIQEERKYVNDGKWDQFPMGSRLFVGNLSSESVTKRDIFHVFHIYGQLAQISIKQAYGFVQFLNADDCARALSTEQGRPIREKRIHLEISKPQKSRNQNNNNNNNRNRSRSPVNRGVGRANHDRGHGSRSERDLHRSFRSPSPRGGYRDRYDDRHRNRSRTPPFSGHSRYGRSPSPRRDLDDDLPLPKRAPQEVPDIQVVVRDTLDRDFISWVEKALSGRGLRVAVLLLSPRLDEDAVMRRQLLEGVLAIIRLDRQSQNTGKVNLRVFNRSRGAHNVTFDDYDNLDPPICAELVLRARTTHNPAPAATPQYGYPPAPVYSQPPQPQYGYSAPSAPPAYAPPPQAYPPQYNAMQAPVQAPSQPPQLDMGSLQNLLATARNGAQAQMATPQAASNPYGYPPQQTSYNGYQNNMNPAALAAMMQQQHQAAARPAPVATAPPPGSSGGQVNMQDILARLGTYNK